ncbi:MAG: PrsW family glutamic-type intramembrane protease [Elainellaceae cyanobacterium]
MVGSLPRTGILRYILPNGLASLEFYPLPFISEVKIGRDPSCHIALDSTVHTGVSRRHAKITRDESQPFCWKIEDLDSSNGTYVNGDRVEVAQLLQEGDRISLGLHGPKFIFESIFAEQSQTRLTSPISLHLDSPIGPGMGPGRFPPKLNGITLEGWYTASLSPAAPTSNSVTFSQLFPIVSTGKELTHKAYLLPGIITVTFVVLLFTSIGNTALFNILLSAYLAIGAYYFVYQLCGRHKPWWILLGSALMTALLMSSPALQLFIFVFRDVLPGAIPKEAESMNLGLLLLQMFLGAGLMEELLKAVPMLLLVWIGSLWRSPKHPDFGLYEPLDGILLGTASAVGFTLMETLGQYVPTIVSDVNFHATDIDQQLLGLQLLIPRILGSVSGHMAYSGYLGYFIGLSVLKPKHRWRILLIGYLTASMLHALWNTTGFVHPAVLAMVGMMSYAFLAAAILKARRLSPTRSQNFATRFNQHP